MPHKLKIKPGKLRIVAGSLKNSRIDVPEATGLRPTSERVRETLFNWLAPDIAGSRCLDLFAGTGALGIEACSRGAAKVCFVERDRHLADLLKANITRLKIGNSEVHRQDALVFLALAPPPAPYDIVFLDPPFAENLWGPTALALQTHDWLTPGALIYVESTRAQPLDFPHQWRLYRESAAGSVRYALYRNDTGIR